MLNFFINGLTKKFDILVGSWPVNRLTADNLEALTLHVIEKVIIRIVADNAAINTKLFKLLHTDEETGEYWIWHPCRPGRKIYISFDYTHIAKNVRSPLLAKPLRNNGKLIKGELLSTIYGRDKAKTLRPLRFVKKTSTRRT